MVSKVLFLVLVGCAFALAKPIEESTEVDQSKENVQVVELNEEETKKLFEEVEEKFKNIWEKISNPSSESFDGVFQDIKNVFDKILKEHGLKQESIETAEFVESQESVEESLVEETPDKSKKDQE